jgi:hypothetical protein
MFADIEQAILAQFKTQGLLVDNLDVRRDPAGVLIMPAAVCHVEQGTMTKISATAFRVDARVYVDLVFKFMGLESDRRKQIYPILEAALGMLTLQSVGLDIHPLEPVSFQNITTPDDAAKSAIIFRMIFATYWEISRTDYVGTSALLKVLLTEYLQPLDKLRSWEKATAYVLGERVVPNPTNGHRYKCTTAGISGAAQPVWPVNAAGTVGDGTITWTEDGAELIDQASINIPQ